MWFQAIENRVNLTSHTLASLQSVKLLGLSKEMEAAIQRRRTDELKTARKVQHEHLPRIWSLYEPSMSRFFPLSYSDHYRRCSFLPHGS